jgi:monolysocardiolipin acyltransferase
MLVLNETRIDNIEIFRRHHAAMSDKPLLTVSNHCSVADDPFVVGMFLPQKDDWDSSKHRWSVCKEEICHKYRASASYFSAGKTLPIQQGPGITQNQFRIFAEKLVPGSWCHIFPEGICWQCGRVGGDDRWNDYRPHLRWGVGKMVATAKVRPVVLPFYHSGMDQMFPQDTTANRSLVACRLTGQIIRVRFGEPITFDDLFEAYWNEEEGSNRSAISGSPGHPQLTGALEGHPQLTGALEEWRRPPTEAEARLYSAIAARIQTALVQLEGEIPDRIPGVCETVCEK